MTSSCASNDTLIYSLRDINEFGALEKVLLTSGLKNLPPKTEGDIDFYNIKAFDKEIAIQVNKKQSIPSGINHIQINGKKFELCSPDKYLLIDNLAIYSLKINGSKFICVYSGYTPCNSYNCRKVRFNLFKIDDLEVKQFSFDNIFGDVNIFGDINKDGYLDFLSTTFSDNTPNEPNNYYDYISISVLSVEKDNVKKLKGDKTYSMKVKFNPEESGRTKEFKFKIIKSNWFRKI